MHVGGEVINGVDVEVHVDAKHGGWEIRSVAGDRLGYGDTKAKAVSQARTKLAKSKTRVRIEFITTTGERGIATGLHASNRAVLAKIGGASVQLATYGDRRALSGDTPPEKVARILELRAQASAATREADQIERDYGIDLQKAVETAVAEKLATDANEADQAVERR